MEAIQVQVKDGRKKVRTLSITGFIKPSGKAFARVTNDEGKVYFVCGDKCHKCPSYKKCYHRQAVAQIAHLLPTCEQIEQEAALSTYDVVAAAIEVVAQAEAKYELPPDAYESLASTKKCACCGHLYQPDRCQPGRCHWNGWYKPEAA